MQAWNEDNHNACTETYLLIGQQWAARTPNFALDDFVKLKPKVWDQILSVERDLDSPNSTISGVKYGIERLKNLWMDLITAGEIENKKLIKQGYEIIPTEVKGFQLYRDDADLLKYTFVKVDLISFAALRRWFRGDITLAEALEDKTPPCWGCIWICDDGSVRAKRKVKVKEKIPEPETKEKVVWRKQDSSLSIVDDFTDIDIAGYTPSPLKEIVEEIEPLTLPPQAREFDDFDIVEAFD